ncbi:MAG: hypothetical protein K6T70_06085 [Meiothermus ruber]|uniref:hypothetical protein n=1 Tax=Meiothermus ruber TaxID=277 RepID=UPI0023F76144|nr:hypothetical protein [Meiothermus ruber]MCL6529673.1 hypothetical protein [Meiothermus ruber]
MTATEQYLKALATMKFTNPTGPSARMAQKLTGMTPKEAVDFAHGLRADEESSAKLARGAFAMINSLCALDLLDKTGSIKPFLRTDLTPTAERIALERKVAYE